MCPTLCIPTVMHMVPLPVWLLYRTLLPSWPLPASHLSRSVPRILPSENFFPKALLTELISIILTFMWLWPIYHITLFYRKGPVSSPASVGNQTYALYYPLVINLTKIVHKLSTPASLWIHWPSFSSLYGSWVFLFPLEAKKHPSQVLILLCSPYVKVTWLFHLLIERMN